MAKAVVIDPKGASATSLGEIIAPPVAPLWLLIADADLAATWRGDVDETDPDDDFQRALDGGVVTVGNGKGFVLRVGDCSRSKIWKTKTGIMLAEAVMNDEGRKADRELALRVAQWPMVKQRKKLGQLIVTSGVMALLSPMIDGKFTPGQRAAAKKTLVKNRSAEKALVPMPKGTYEIRQSRLGPEELFEDDVGFYGVAIWIEKKA